MESFLTEWGYAALILFGFLEAACIPISSEITFGFAGVLAYQGHLNLALVIIVGTLAELAGSYASYAVGRIGGRPLVHKLGRYVLVTESDVARAERFLEGRGAWAIPVGRMLPFVRAFISIVAGPVRHPEPDRHGHLRGHALLDRVRARQRLGERQPRPDHRGLHPVRPDRHRDRGLRHLPPARVPPRGPAEASRHHAPHRWRRSRRGLPPGSPLQAPLPPRQVASPGHPTLACEWKSLAAGVPLDRPSARSNRAHFMIVASLGQIAPPVSGRDHERGT